MTSVPRTSCDLDFERPVSLPKYTRSKRGCLTCRNKKIKCDETRPVCTRCSHSKRLCAWPTDSPKNEVPQKRASSHSPEARLRSISPLAVRTSHLRPFVSTPSHPQYIPSHDSVRNCHPDLPLDDDPGHSSRKRPDEYLSSPSLGEPSRSSIESDKSDAHWTSSSTPVILPGDGDHDSSGGYRRSASIISVDSIKSLGWEVPPALGGDDGSLGQHRASDLTDQIAGTPVPIAIGGYSQVHLRQWIPLVGDSQQVAIKTLYGYDLDMTDPETHERKTLKRLLRELRVWQKLDHPNIARLHGYMWEEHFEANVVASLVAQFYGNGPVGAFLLKNPSVDRLQLCCDVADGLAYLHDFDPMIIHGDLKGSNILVNDNHRAVICDFGLSSLKDNHATGFETSRRGGTLRFLAPELLDDNPTTTQSDVWAFACVCMEILHDRPPYAHLRSEGAILSAIWAKKPPFELPAGKTENDDSTSGIARHNLLHATPPDLAAIFMQCWNHDPAMRLDMRTIQEQLFPTIDPFTPSSEHHASSANNTVF